MKSKQIFFQILFIGAFLCSDAQTENYYNKKQLKTKKSITVSSYGERKGNPQKKGSADTYLYDINGNLIQHNTSRFDQKTYEANLKASEVGKDKYTYFDDYKAKKLLREKSRIPEKTISKYDKNNKILEWVRYTNDSIFDCKWTYKYDEFGNNTEIYDSYKNRTDTIIHEYINNKKSKSYYKGSKKWITIYNYNEDSSMTREVTDSTFGSEFGSNSIYKKIYKYDSAGNNIELLEYNFDFSSTVYLDSAGNNIELLDYMDSLFVAKNEYKYNEYGNILEHIKYKDNLLFYKECFEYVYEYDYYGNWIKRQIFEYNSEKGEFNDYYSITERVIEYY